VLTEQDRADLIFEAIASEGLIPVSKADTYWLQHYVMNIEIIRRQEAHDHAAGSPVPPRPAPDARTGTDAD
jgi:hypothetical protein